MDDRGWVHHHLDQVVRHAEQKMGLDQLEALVRERRRINGDLRPHRPRRMRERVLDGDLVGLQPLRAPAAKRPAGRREHVAGGGRPTGGLDELEERRVLAVDGNQLASAAPPSLQSELAAGDEALLVRRARAGGRARGSTVSRAVRRSRRSRSARRPGRSARAARSGRRPQTCAARRSHPKASSRTRRRRARAADRRRSRRASGARSTPSHRELQSALSLRQSRSAQQR